MRKFLGALFLAAVAVPATPAHAQWYEAQSDHFVIYAKDSEQDIQEFAVLLERYHAAMQLLSGRDVPKPSPSNRVTIYVVGGESKIKEMAGSRSVAGFYIPRAGGSAAFVPSIRMKRNEPDFSQIVLLHEYAHHYLISSSRHAMPRWLSEGAAEFYASARLMPDDTLQIGRPAYHRGEEIAYAADVSAEQLLDPEVYEKRRSNGYDSFYGRSWALVHYLNFDEARKGQLGAYWNEIATGTAPRAAAEKVFGDLKQLEKDLEAYLRKRKIFSYNLKPAMLPIGTVTVRPMSIGMGEVMPLLIQSKRGVSREEALKLLPKIQGVAARYPTDAGVLATLAEAEYDAGNDAAAIVAADQAITADPATKNAYIQKGYALFRQAGDANDREAAFKAALVPFQQLNKLEPDHPLPLIYYYRSFAKRGMAPTELARHALENAAQMAPFDYSLALEAARMLADEGQIGWARMMLQPVAGAPHSSRRTTLAQNYLEQLETVEEGTRHRFTDPPVSPDNENTDDEGEESDGTGKNAIGNKGNAAE